MNLFKIAICSAAALLSLSCSKSVNTGGLGSGDGTVSFAVSNYRIVDDVTKSNVSDYTSLPSAGDFTISLTNSDNLEIYKGFVSAWDSEKPLKGGNYTVKASYGTEGDEGFDKPYFSGQTAFVVNGGNKTNVSIPASLGNSIVKLSFSDNFKNYFTDWNLKLTTGTGTQIDFPKSETRAVFVDAYKFTLSGTFTKQGGGSPKTFSKEYNSLESATCYTISFDASTVGGLKISVTFNDTVETIDCGDVELND